MKTRINKYISNSVETYISVLNDISLQENIEMIVKKSIIAFKDDKKILFCGNGGSASDAQHIAAELSGRFHFDRPPLYAEALHVNSSYMTAVSNDYGYDQTYSRMLEACGRHGDILVGISTSGNSQNVVNALEKANEIGLTTVGFTGINGGQMNEICDIMLKVPSEHTARIQEAHILIGHIICQLIEEEMFSNE
ncbi:MAG: phosphoheptose isomerase [Flavobacteriales bacterium]|nr:phosphoheptose isomerase [Flavobacteriales bacterium]|tara:strand:- start:61851 stop:62432 length:582 start_codon:yes stop_codon:yes gene_type:complete